jgi:hypothetical protein
MAEVVFAVAVWSPVVAPMVAVVAATGCLLPVGSLGAVAGEVAEATNGAVGVAAGLPLLQRSILPAGFGAERPLGVIDPPALPVRHHLPDRAIPRAATLDRRRPCSEVA